MDACIENNLQAVIVAVVLGAMSIIGNCVMGYKLMCGSGEHRTVAQRLEMVNLKNIKKSKLKSKDIEEYVMEIGEDNDRHIVQTYLSGLWRSTTVATFDGRTDNNLIYLYIKLDERIYQHYALSKTKGDRIFDAVLQTTNNNAMSP